MKRTVQLYRLSNLLSLDVVTGAVICAIFFSQIFETSFKLNGLIALGLTVWVIYTTDHLLDAKKVKHTASTERHRFHQENFSLLGSLVIVAIVIDASQLFFIRRPVLVGGFLLALIIVAYLLVQRYLKYLKEFFAAILYSGGVLLVPLSMRVETVTSMHIIIVIQFFVTALINLLLFSWFDHTRDEQDQRESFTTFFGESITKRALAGLLIVNVLLFTGLSWFYFNEAFFPSVVIVLMNFVLLVIMMGKKYFVVKDRYRLIGDAVFLLPLVYILLTRWA